MWSINARRDHHRERPIPGLAKPNNVEPEDRRLNTADRNSAQSTLIALRHLTNVESTRGLSMNLDDTVNEHSSATVGECRNVLGHVGLREVPLRW